MTTETQKLLGADNRIIQSIARIEAALKTKTPYQLAKLDEALKVLLPGEIAAYQERKSLAQSSGVISLEEATTVYRTICDWREASLAQRMTVTALMGQLMGVSTRRG